jgi:hypothetical protein
LLDTLPHIAEDNSRLENGMNIEGNVTKLDTSTKQAGDLPAVKTHVTINWEGMERGDLIALAQQTIVIKVQAGWRRAKDGIPTEATINAVDHKVGTRVRKAAPDILELAKNATPEQKAALIAMLRGDAA